MAGLSDLLGRNGVLEQLFLWSVVSEAVRTSLTPALTVLEQDVNAGHPEQALDPGTAADLAARGIITVDAGRAEAAKSGIDAARWAQLADMHKIRLPPADLATAVLRSYVSRETANTEAAPQGVTPAMMDVLVDLAGDAPGPDQLAAAVRRGLITEAGTGPGSTSYQQGIAETRLHNKWGPVLLELTRQLLSPADAASGVVRNFVSEADGAAIAARNGVDAGTFATLVHLSGDAPAPGQLAEALRRGLIPAAGRGPTSDSFEQGIAEGRLADKWADTIKGLAKLWPTPTDALDAAIKGQLTTAEGRAAYERLGGDLQWYTMLFDTIGEGPTPLEAAILNARGIIPQHGTGHDSISYDQAVRESRYRNKWTDAYRELSRHIPPPSTIVTMLAHRQLDEQAAHTLLLQNDMTPDLAAAYVGEAQYEAISDYRGLTQSAVVDMYIAHLISDAQAVQLLEVLHVSPEAAKLLLSYADLHYVIDSINRSVQRIASLFTGRKISTATARDALAKLQIPSGTVDEIIQGWELQAAANVKLLTETQIIDAWYYEAFTLDEAISELQAIGYTPYDAWALLSIKAKGPLPNPPARTVAPPPGAVIPGVT